MTIFHEDGCGCEYERFRLRWPYEERFYLHRRGEPEREVSRREFQEKEAEVGFWPKFPGHPATGSFAAEGWEGRSEYVRGEVDSQREHPAAHSA